MQARTLTPALDAAPLVVFLAFAAGPALVAQTAVETFAAELERAHFTGPEKPDFDRFLADLKITSLAQDQDAVDVQLRAQFVAPRYIRYEVDESGTKIERGWDRNGAWSAPGDGRVIDLNGRDHAVEAATVREHRRLAQQLLRFLDPSQVLAQLEDASLAQKETAEPLFRGEKGFPCRTIRGRLPDFPIDAEADPDNPQPVQIKIWVDEAEKRLARLQVRPLDSEGKPAAHGELVVLQDYRVDARGVAIPTLMLLYRLDFDGETPRLEADSRVDIRTIDLSPDLSKEDLDRPS